MVAARRRRVTVSIVSIPSELIASVNAKNYPTKRFNSKRTGISRRLSPLVRELIEARQHKRFKFNER